MLFAIITWVSASRWVARAAASSALIASSAIHCSSRASGGTRAVLEAELLQEAGDEGRA